MINVTEENLKQYKTRQKSNTFIT